MTIVSIHQPNFVPWIGYFYKIVNCDVFVFLDNVQYTKNSFINRNKIKTPQRDRWLTVPVSFKFGQLINEVKINNNVQWRKKNLRTIEINYKKAPHYDAIYDLLKSACFRNEWELLTDLNIKLINTICQFLDLRVKTIRASTLGFNTSSTDLLIKIIKKLDGKIYLSGKGGANYQDEEKFKQNGISLLYTDFIGPIYPQLYGDFIPNLSIIDLLFNCGSESIKYISQKKRDAYEAI